MKRLILLLILIGLIGYFSYVILFERKQTYNKIISPLADSMEEIGLLEKKNEQIEKIVLTIIAERDGEYAVYYKDLETDTDYILDGHKSFQSASLYKLWIMGEAFAQIDKGTLQKEDMMKSSVEDLNKKFNIASESAEKKEGEIELSVEDGLEQMITISDNYAALLLSSKVRLSNVTTFLKTYGFTDSSIGVPPKTSAHDIGMFFEKVYKGEMIGQIYSKEMLSILGRQRLNDRLPKYLPEGVIVAHKTGELDGYKHDGGIIYATNGPYILVVLSKSLNEAYAAETIALISKEIYDYKNSTE